MSESDEDAPEKVTYIRVYESDADRIHDESSRQETNPETVRRILDEFEE